MAEPENERISSATVLLILLTFPLSVAGVPALPPGLGVLPDPGPRVHSHGLLDHETVLDELADVLPRIGVGNLVDLVGVQPDLWGQSQASGVESLESSAPCSCRTS